LAFSALIVFLLLAGGVGIVGMGRVQVDGQAMYRDRVAPLPHLNQVAFSYAVAVVGTFERASAGLIPAEAAAQGLTQALAGADSAWQAYRAGGIDPEDAQLAREAEALFGVANDRIARVLAFLKTRQGSVKGELDELRAPLYEAVDPIAQKVVLGMIGRQLTVAQALSQSALAQYQWSRAVTAAVMAVAVLVAALLAWAIGRSIAAPLSTAVRVATAIREGDLSRTIHVKGGDEASDMLAALRDMQASLGQVVSEVRGGVESVTTASGQIAAGNQDLSGRTEQQAQSLQETAASMAQLNTTVRQNADTARQAAQLASSASSVASAGGDVVGRVVLTMEAISASSKKIADIIGTIDGIAFQTNILALNAAVEAARAGEQGRGFAVVAGEVRNLAQRSAEAAKEIKTLIDTSVEKVEAGSALVGEAGTTMGEIVTQVRRVSDLLGEITAAVAEQSNGIGQVNQTVSQMDQATQQNAAMVQQSAAAARSLAEQARRLSAVVAGFRLA
jgi:methyl-accepting chemotaxis protein